MVRPGRYGDLDANGVLAGPGEEMPSSIPGSQGGIYVAKALTVLSTAGAGATVIDVGHASYAAVEIGSNGVRFGDRAAGFTLTGGLNYGLIAEGRTDVTIAGNLARDVPFAGFLVGSSGFVELRSNTAVRCGSAGIWVQGSDGGTPYVSVVNNTAISNSTGIVVGSLAPHRVTSNRVSGNDIGLAINFGPSRIAQNQVTGNRTGVMINGYSDAPQDKGPLLIRNNFVGNRANGVDLFPGPAGVITRLRENNIFGNGNCGTTNQSNIGGSVGATLDARNNYWGAATGPSFNDPADPACQGLHPTLSEPFASSEFEVR